MAGQESERQKQRKSLPPQLCESRESSTIAQKGMDDDAQSRTLAKAGAAEQEKAIAGRQSCRKRDLRPNFAPTKFRSSACFTSVLSIPSWLSIRRLSLFDDGFDQFDAWFHIAIENRDSGN